MAIIIVTLNLQHWNYRCLSSGHRYFIFHKSPVNCLLFIYLHFKDLCLRGVKWVVQRLESVSQTGILSLTPGSPHLMMLVWHAAFFHWFCAEIFIMQVEFNVSTSTYLPFCSMGATVALTHVLYTVWQAGPVASFQAENRIQISPLRFSCLRFPFHHKIIFLQLCYALLLWVNKRFDSWHKSRID